MSSRYQTYIEGTSEEQLFPVTLIKSILNRNIGTYSQHITQYVYFPYILLFANIGFF